MPSLAYLTKKKPHSEASYRELADGDVAALVAELEAIGEDPEKFQAFIKAVESAHFAAPSALRS